MPVDLPHDRVILVTDLRRPRRTDDRLTDSKPGSLGYRQRRLLTLDQRAALRPLPDQVQGFRAKKIVFQLQLADLPVQKIDLTLAGRAFRHRTADLKKPSPRRPAAASSAVDLVQMNPELARQLGHRPIPVGRRQRHLCFQRSVVLLARPPHVLLPRHRRF
jgi:hypothetical protein